MPGLTAAMLIVVGIIHLLPLSGVLGAARLEALYGVAVEDPNLLVLLRHRAVLFGLLGVLLLLAAVRPALQVLALTTGFVSVASFVWLAWSAGGVNAALARVMTVDLVASVCLVVAALSWVLTPGRA